MVKHGADYIDLHLVNDEHHSLSLLDENENHPDIQDRGDCVRVRFSAEEQLKRAGALHPRVATL